MLRAPEDSPVKTDAAAAGRTRSEKPQNRSQKAVLAVVLAWTAGVVDAAGYILLSHVFTAHMSGDSAAMAVYAGSHDAIRLVARALPIPVFVIAVYAGGFVTEVAAELGVRRRLGLLAVVELILLMAFFVYALLRPAGLTQAWNIQYFVLVALLTTAMGLQTAALQRVGGRTIRTTYVTGMLTNFSNEMVAWSLERWRGSGSHSSRRRAGLAWRRALLFIGIWCAFAIGALLGGFGEPLWRQWALLPAMAGLLLVIALEIARPIYG